ncbi:mechanosensitive ion channel protein MscS [filamentous cyanobacterium CCP5]|nr:mechanosensitive ion channel protein MscS [filamentous cyanobacterium CCP5]
MDFRDIVQELFAFDAAFRQEALGFLLRLGGFILLVLVAWLVGQLIPNLLRFLIVTFAPQTIAEAYEQVVTPVKRSLINAGFLALSALSLAMVRDYRTLFNFLNFFVYLALAIAVGWLLSRLVSQVLRVYGIKLFQRFSQDVDDFVLVTENLLNAVIAFFAIIYFAQSQNLNLISLLAGLGIVGLALSFAAKETIAQVIGSIVLYLDRPYLPGEYVRVSFNPKAEDVYGRIESIGIRSTKIRVAVKNTLIIAPNSVMVAKDIENISRGNKVMALLYIDFDRRLPDRDWALVKELLEDCIGSIYGVEPLSTQVVLFEPEDKPGTRARTSFFLLSSDQGTLSLRKRLVEVAHQKITKELGKHNLTFSMGDPILYVDSPITR